MPTYKEQIEQIIGQPIEIKRWRVESFMSKTHEEGSWEIWIDKQIIAGFKLVCMPGCCGIVVSTGAYVAAHQQGKGLGTLLNQMRVQIAWQLGYTVMICTDVEGNEPQRVILRTNGWDNIWYFTNRRTQNVVNVDMIDLFDTRVSLGFEL